MSNSYVPEIPEQAIRSLDELVKTARAGYVLISRNQARQIMAFLVQYQHDQMADMLIQQLHAAIVADPAELRGVPPVDGDG